MKDVIPDEEPVPAAFLRRRSQLGQHPRIGELAERRDIYGTFHPAERTGNAPGRQCAPPGSTEGVAASSTPVKSTHVNEALLRSRELCKLGHYPSSGAHSSFKAWYSPQCRGEQKKITLSLS